MSSIDYSGVEKFSISAHNVLGNGTLYAGYGTGPTDGSTFGIKANGAKEFSIVDPGIQRVATGVDISNVPKWQDGGAIRGGRISHCYRAVHLHNYAEGVFISGLVASDCVFGIVIDSGNSNLSNGQTTRCSVGLFVSGGANNGHGSVMGWNSRHNAYNLSCQNVAYGHYFGGCNFMGGQNGSDQGGMQFINSKGIMVNGGQIAYSDITIDADSQVAIHNAVFRGPVNVTVTAGGIFDAKNNLVMPGATLTLNGSAWGGNN